MTRRQCSWTNHEIALLRACFSGTDRADIEALLPRHTWTAIVKRATKCGFRRTNGNLRWWRMAHVFFRAKEREVAALRNGDDAAHTPAWTRSGSLTF